MTSFKEDLNKILLRDNLISTQDLERALEEQAKNGGELSKILVRLKLIDENTLTQILSEGLGLPVINISRLKIDPEAVKIIPKETAKKYQIFPVSLLGDHLTLAMADPFNVFVIDNVQALTGHTITPIISKAKEIEDAIQKYYFEQDSTSATEALEEIMKDLKDSGDVEWVKDDQQDANKATVEKISDEAPIIKLADTIIQQSVMAKASDVFIEPLEKAVRIRFRDRKSVV